MGTILLTLSKLHVWEKSRCSIGQFPEEWQYKTVSTGETPQRTERSRGLPSDDSMQPTCPDYRILLVKQMLDLNRWSFCAVYGPTFLGLVNCLKAVEVSVIWAGVIDRDAAMGITTSNALDKP